MLRDRPIDAGVGIIAANQSGNRDESVFSEPDVFDMMRFAPKQDGGRGEDWYKALGFGWGEHRCIGERLSRAELEIVFGELCLVSLQVFQILCDPPWWLVC